MVLSSHRFPRGSLPVPSMTPVGRSPLLGDLVLVGLCSPRSRAQPTRALHPVPRDARCIELQTASVAYPPIRARVHQGVMGVQTVEIEGGAGVPSTVAGWRRGPPMRAARWALRP